MRVTSIFLVLLCGSVSVSAQRVVPGRSGRALSNAANAEMSVNQAAEQLGAEKKAFDRDVEVLRHLHAAEKALTDPTQPTTAVQKAFEEVATAKGLITDFYLTQSVVQMDRELENARRSPASADFGRLRSLLQQEVTAPAARLVVRNAILLEEETRAWIRIEELIASHLRMLSEISGESLRASQ